MAEPEKPPAEDDEDYDPTGGYDLGPWLETPQSTRVSRFRYDFGNRAIQVQWRNNSNHGYIYRGVDYEIYRGMARIASKGRYVNTDLNNLPYEKMNADEVSAASNLRRKRPGFGRDVGGYSYEGGEAQE